jgi:hypothetical protein
MRVPLIPTLLGLALVACRSIPPEGAPARYIVTTAPLGVDAVSPGLCVAVDLTDPQGIWWWEPGRSGCSSRSTGPGVFHAEHATVAAPSQSGAIEVRFRLQLIVGPGSTMPDFADIRLVLQDGGMRAMASGARVPTERRNDLEVPEQPPGR